MKATNGTDHRTVSFVARPAKFVERVLRGRIERNIEEVHGAEQSGFRRTKKRGAIGMLGIISERTLHIDQEFCTCLIDWKKAFDRINRAK